MTTHITVLLKEAVDALLVKKNQWYIDATVGGGGHTQRILDQGGKVVGLDFDESAITQAQEKFKDAVDQGSIVLVRENFDKLSTVIGALKAAQKIKSIHGIIFDFGTSTDQLMNDQRGLSFASEEAVLDMRMDSRLGVKAADLLKLLGVKQLTEVFQNLGGEENAKGIAKAIVAAREKNPHQLETVGALVTLIAKHKPHRNSHLHPATKVFQALRIVVNDELDNIARALPQAISEVAPGGRIVTIAFHEGEDRLVKQTFAHWEEQHRGIRVTKKPLQASEAELAANPRSRSAKLRVFERKLS